MKTFDCSTLPRESLPQIEAVNYQGWCGERILQEANRFVLLPLKLLQLPSDLEKVDSRLQYLE
jgi:hypothetical protein